MVAENTTFRRLLRSAPRPAAIGFLRALQTFVSA